MITAPKGKLEHHHRLPDQDSGLVDPVVLNAKRRALADRRLRCLIYLLGSRYCETDRHVRHCMVAVRPSACRLDLCPGDLRLSRIINIKFGYNDADAKMSAWEVYNRCKRRLPRLRASGHYAVPLRNIPARYCTGYLGDMGTPKPWAAGDFAAWMIYLGGAWHIFDPRNNVRVSAVS